MMGLRRFLLVGVALASFSSTALAAPGDAKLKALYDAEWTWRTEQMALADEDDVRADHYPSVTPASQQARLAYWSKALAELDKIPIADLSPEERINASVFRTALEAFVAQIKYKEYEDAWGFWTWMSPRSGFATVADYRAYIGRLKDTPRYVDEQIANMRSGLKRGFTPPAVAIAGRDVSIAPLASADPEKNPGFTPFTMFPANISAADRETLLAEGRAAITGSFAPAFAKLTTFVRDEYLPKARKSTAAEALPDGKAYYAAKVKEFTTLDLTPDQIHEIGLKEVARIDADMQATMKKSGWKGDFPSFLTFLKTDPQFYAKTPYELLARANMINNKVNGQLKHTLGLLPRWRFMIRPTPDAVARFGTGGNGGLESCVFNTYNLPAWKLYTLPSLVVHECNPGHSLQAALALEGPNRPAIRKTTYFSGYGEGWGLYTEWLGIGMGIYETPYEEFGRETYEMWRAARLVVDTGMAHKGWSRQQAIDFLKAHTALSDHEVTMEIDRYLINPGQALAYKLGELTIRRKRAEAEAKLGPKFDQRWFHDVLLGVGAVPLPVLEQVLDEWVANGGKNPNPGVAGTGPDSH